MENRYARYGAASGIVAVVVLVVGFLIFSSGIPHLDASALRWQAFFVKHQDRIQTGLTIVFVGLFFFLWFLGSLREALRTPAMDGGRLGAIAFGGGIVAVVSLVAGGTAYLTAAFHPQGVDANLTRAFSDYAALIAAPAAAGFTALFAATAVAGYRDRVLPAPVAGISATAAIGQLFAFPSGVTDHGAFAADGALGFWVPFVTFFVAIVAISGTLARRATEVRAAAAPGGP
jgi:hypothetical protein